MSAERKFFIERELEPGGKTNIDVFGTNIDIEHHGKIITVKRDDGSKENLINMGGEQPVQLKVVTNYLNRPMMVDFLVDISLPARAKGMFYVELDLPVCLKINDEHVIELYTPKYKSWWEAAKKAMYTYIPAYARKDVNEIELDHRSEIILPIELKNESKYPCVIDMIEVEMLRLDIFISEEEFLNFSTIGVTYNEKGGLEYKYHEKPPSGMLKGNELFIDVPQEPPRPSFLKSGLMKLFE